MARGGHAVLTPSVTNGEPMLDGRTKQVYELISTSSKYERNYPHHQFPNKDEGILEGYDYVLHFFP